MKDIIKVFKSLSDPTRLRILMLLIQSELCVCELTFILKMEQSRISHQLRILRNAELVEDKRSGKWIIYRIPKETKKNLKVIFDQIIGDGLLQLEEINKDRENLSLSLEKDIRGCRIQAERRGA